MIQYEGSPVFVALSPWRFILVEAGFHIDDDPMFQQERDSSEFRKDPRWRLKVEEFIGEHGNDGCSSCGDRGVYLQVHHLVDCDTVEEYLDLENGVTATCLCRPCHLKHTYKIFERIETDLFKRLVKKYQA